MKIRIILTFSFLFLTITCGVGNITFENKLPGDSSLSQVLAPVAEEAFNELQVPGVIIGVWMGDKTPWIKTYGVEDLETRQQIKVDDKVRIGSITKTFTGTVLLQLVDEGKLKLDDKLSKFFADFPNGDSITIHELGNMTSGIYNYSEDTLFENNMLDNLTKYFSPEQLVDIAKKHPPYFSPGTSFHYSNTNTILLGLIIEKITGNKIGDEIQKRILDPLGMSNTTFATGTNFPEPHAQGYFYLTPTDSVPANVTIVNPNWAWSAGAIISTLDDLHKYAKPLATGQLISARTQEERLKWVLMPPISSGPWKGLQLRYGFAIADFIGAYGHDGGIPGFNSVIGYMPDKDATIIVLSNMQENKKGMSPSDYIAVKIIEKINNTF